MLLSSQTRLVRQQFLLNSKSVMTILMLFAVQVLNQQLMLTLRRRRWTQVHRQMMIGESIMSPYIVTAIGGIEKRASSMHGLCM